MTDNNQSPVPPEPERSEPGTSDASQNAHQPQADAQQANAHQPQADPAAAPPYGQQHAQQQAPQHGQQPGYGQQHSQQQPYGQQGYQQAPPPGYQQGYAQPGYQQAPPPGYAPGYDPYAKSRLAAGLLGIFLGSLGIHRFYLGYTGIGIAQIVVTFVTFGFGALWGFIEGIMILARAQSFNTDAEGRPLRD